jgi:hypothetical protein
LQRWWTARVLGLTPATTALTVMAPAALPEIVAGIRVGVLGRERVMASTDCGFGTSAGYGKIDPEIAFLKLAALVEGAARASDQLWS